jgi:diacylglycerol kinase family enzyme
VNRAAVVVNPTKCDTIQQLRSDITATMTSSGWEEPLWLETTAEDPGEGMAREAVRDGADVVFACGGDGTVMACVTALAGSGVPMGVLPLGTGNLLARNLDLPLDMQDALRVGLEGVDRPLDVGTFVAGGAQDEGRKFVVMAGIGFDAAMMADAPEGVKARLGWPAYVVSGLKHLRDRGVDMQIRVDDQPPVRRTARAVIVGNVGKLQGGIVLFPEALPGRRDARRGGAGAAHAGRLGPGDGAPCVPAAPRRRAAPAPAGRRIEIRARSPLPVELDGDPLDEATGVVVEVEPGALLVRVTREPSGG